MYWPFPILGALTNISNSSISFKTSCCNHSPQIWHQKADNISYNDIIYLLIGLRLYPSFSMEQNIEWKTEKFRLTTAMVKLTAHIAVQEPKQDQTFYLSSTQIIMDHFFVKISQKAIPTFSLIWNK